jgi:hypothetical protein
MIESRATESPHAGNYSVNYSVILWSAVAPLFRMHEVPATYGSKVFIRLMIPAPRAVAGSAPESSIASRFRVLGVAFAVGTVAVSQAQPCGLKGHERRQHEDRRKEEHRKEEARNPQERRLSLLER